ncbi:oligosaccharide flippase family protein [Spirosoma soli]|uniref:Oligosaccharide flippase family protein n=1 Tax=Spirosoma soli TaxID=1770529 RepID=A0ABW5M2M0_9BACT
MMSSSINYFRERIRNAHPRTRKAQLNTVLGLLIKGGGMAISLLLVPLTIDYLSTERYGTWLTISSIVTMLTFFDIGIGNGLRNKLSEAISKQDINLARSYVSTAYLIFGILQLFFIVVFLLIFRFVPWQQILNTTIDNGQLQFVVLLTAIGIAVKLVMDIVSYVLFALQESSQASFIALLSNVVILLGTYLLTHYLHGNLKYLAVVTAVSPILVIGISSVVLYKSRLSLYKPTLRMVDFKYAKSLLSLGYKFFVIQLAVIILFYTDNLIITQLFGSSEVTVYNVAFRYFNAANTLFMIAITPYWSAFTEAYAKNDTIWMKKTYYYLQKLWVGLVVGIIIMVLLSNTIYSLWVGSRVVVPIQLSICMGIFVIISCWNSVVVAVANGVGKIQFQLYYSVFSAIVNVPLAVLFGKMLGMGSAGVILASGVSLLFGSVFGGIQAYKILSGTAKGIWNK